MRPYIIWSPEWDHKVGGIRALYGLRDELRARGHVANVHRDVVFDPEAIVVYPEIEQGNPLGASRLVRWRLQPAEVPDDGVVYNWTDYGDHLPTLMVDLFEPGLFARRDGARSGVVLWVHKGRFDPDVIPDGVKVTTMTAGSPETRAEVADLLGSAEYLISFDEFSSVNLEALLLGTPVLLYPSGGYFTREQVAGQAWARHGVVFDPDHLVIARGRTRGAWPWYAAERRRMATEVDIFAIETQARWPTSG